jgi:hypothetical protein
VLRSGVGVELTGAQVLLQQLKIQELARGEWLEEASALDTGGGSVASRACSSSSARSWMRSWSTSSRPGAGCDWAGISSWPRGSPRTDDWS